MKGFWLILTVATAAAPAAAEAPHTQPAPASRPAAAQFDTLLDEIRRAETPEAVAAAYAEATGHHPLAQVLHEAYLRRMLRFGLVRIAGYPARRLLRIEPGHGLASAAMAYLHGREDRKADALETSLPVAAKLRDNPGFANNLGQLVAWYDHASEPPELSAAARRLLAGSRDTLGEQEAFARAYERVAAACEQRKEQLAALDERANELRTARRDIEMQLTRLAARWHAVRDEIEDCHDRIDALEDELRFTVHYDAATGTYYYDTERRRLLQLEIGSERRAIRRLRREAALIKSRIVALRAELDPLRDRIGALNEQRDASAGIVARAFRWDPPAVDGRITPAVEHPGQVPRPVSASRPAAEPPSRTQQKLDLARLYLTNGLRDKAREILQQVAEQEDNPDAAAEARSLLAEMGPAD
ncbi:MAG: hypothetical protein KGY99_08450 [Phycisphaerae bacterium]|nr:hypothetical protein [Phycisphaerae bacterium]